MTADADHRKKWKLPLRVTPMFQYDILGIFIASSKPRLAVAEENE